MEWRPIGTAPREGIILGWDGTDLAIIQWISWSDGSGEWDVAHDHEGYAWSDYEPTHWMPLPQPPEGG